MASASPRALGGVMVVGQCRIRNDGSVIPGLYAGGDATSAMHIRGRLAVISELTWAVASAYLGHQRRGLHRQQAQLRRRSAPCFCLITVSTRWRIRIWTPHRTANRRLSVEERITSFDEVDAGLTEEQALNESACLKCPTR